MNDISPIVWIIYFAIVIFYIYVLWQVYTKAKQPGWGCIIPIYDVYLLLKIAGKPGWWLLLFFIPLVNIVIALLVYLGIAENFGKSAAFGIGLFFLGFIFFPILAFGDAKYKS